MSDRFGIFRHNFRCIKFLRAKLTVLRGRLAFLLISLGANGPLSERKSRTINALLGISGCTSIILIQDIVNMKWLSAIRQIDYQV
ncbi:MAG: hypothetical protein ACXADL_05310 [Candidatus Thorarchaeota archaeon]